MLKIITFGFKYGVKGEFDMLFDARVLPNPYYINELKDKTGLDDDVYNYVINSKEAKEFLPYVVDIIKYTLKKRENVTVAIACTGGCHRSVSVARYLSTIFPCTVFNYEI